MSQKRTGFPVLNRAIGRSTEKHPPISSLVDSLGRVWRALEGARRLGDVTMIHEGIELESSVTYPPSDFPGTPLPAYHPVLTAVTAEFEPYVARGIRYLKTDESPINGDIRKLSWQAPKIIMNAVAFPTDCWITDYWVVAAIVDDCGCKFTKQLCGIWPKAGYPLAVIGAFLNGPVANAFLRCHVITRRLRIGLLRQIPVPHLTSGQQQVIISLINQYRDLRTEWINEGDRGNRFEPACRTLIEQIDAEVLCAYDMSPRLERQFLDRFAGIGRPSPVHFDRFYPPDFRPAIPWRHFISEGFRESSAERTVVRLPIIRDPEINEMVEAMCE